MVVTDATCPVVTAAAQQVRTFAEQGETVILVAGPSHAATPGLVGQAPERVMVTASLSGVAAVEVADRRRVAVVMEPGAPLTRTVPVAEAVRRRFGQVLPQHSASLCHEPSDRVAALRRLAAETDVVLVVGPAGRDGFEVGAEIKAAGTQCHQVASPEDIEAGWLRDTASVGITATLSAEPRLIERITSALGGLGPTTVVALAADTVPVAVPVAVPVTEAVTTTPSVGLTPV
jgi:4-hydroxy-3-methylbut-2-enyl diphosphate reductase